LQYCVSSRTTEVGPIDFCAFAWPCSIASLNSYFPEERVELLGAHRPERRELVACRVVLEQDRGERLRRGPGQHARAGRGIVDAVIGAAVDHLRVRRCGAPGLIAE
jgi:hypothetical protein